MIRYKVRNRSTRRNSATKKVGARKFLTFVSGISKKVSPSGVTKTKTAKAKKKMNSFYDDDDSCSNIYLTSSSDKEDEEGERDVVHSISEQQLRDDTALSTSSPSTSGTFSGRKNCDAANSMITRMVKVSNKRYDTNGINDARNKEGTATCDSTILSSDNEEFSSDNQEGSLINDWEGRASAELQIEKLWIMSQRFEIKEPTESLISSSSFCSNPKEENSLEEGEQQEEDGRDFYGYDGDKEEQNYEYGKEVDLYHNYGSQPRQKEIYDIDEIMFSMIIGDDDSCDEDSMCSFDVLPLYMTDDDALDEVSITQGLVGYADGFEAHTLPISRIEEINGEEKPEI